MPKTSYADVITEWERLLSAVDDHTAKLAGSQAQRQALAAHVDELKSVKARQVAATATRQECTRLMETMVVEGKVLAIQLRGSVKAHIDPRSELLVQFGMAPQRPKGRRAKPATAARAAPNNGQAVADTGQAAPDDPGQVS